MILARNSITVARQTDITSVTWYYKLQASTASKPSKPTTVTPSGWTTTEPTYTEGSTNSLYICQKTTFSDGTFEYSDVSLSSSYEAAKLAYNKAQTSQDTAEDAYEKAVESQDTANSALETGNMNAGNISRLAEQTSQIQQLIDQIQLWVSSIANKRAWTEGQDISAYETDVPPTLDNYPAAEEFWIWPICNTNIYCSDTLICGTNNYAAHLHDIAACRNENKYYIFDQDTTQAYYWRELTESEYRSLSNMYSAINIEAEGIEIRSVLNTVETLLSLTPDGVVVTPGKLLCC